MTPPVVLDIIARSVVLVNQLVCLDLLVPHDSSPFPSQDSRGGPYPTNSTDRCSRVKAANDRIRLKAQAECPFLVEKWEQAVNGAFEIISESEWKIEKNDADTLIRSAFLPAYQRSAFLGEAVLHASPEYMAHIYWDLGNEVPAWNPEMISVEELVTIGSNLRISNLVSRPQLGGFINSRDFVTLSGKLEKEDGIYVIFTNASDDYMPEPRDPTYVRGVSGPGMFAFQRVPGDPARTRFRFLFNKDMRLSPYVPRKLAEKGNVSFMKEYIEIVRRRAERREYEPLQESS